MAASLATPDELRDKKRRKRQRQREAKEQRGISQAALTECKKHLSALRLADKIYKVWPYPLGGEGDTLGYKKHMAMSIPEHVSARNSQAVEYYIGDGATRCPRPATGRLSRKL